MFSEFRRFVLCVLIAFVSNTLLPASTSAACCPRPKGTFKDDPNTLSCVKNQLKAANKGNAAVGLLQQWIAAVYNFQACPQVDNYATIKEAIVITAPQLLGLEIVCCYTLPDLCNYRAPVVKGNTALGAQMTLVAALLEAYNNRFYNDCDGDGMTPSQGDCDPGDPTVFRGAPEIVGDAKDNDCDGEIDEVCPSCAALSLPNPVVALESAVDEGGLTRYELDVTNWSDYPDCIFAHTGEFGSCGENQTPSRTLVTISDQDGVYIYSFCALNAGSDLNNIWFVVPTSDPQPTGVYVELEDQQCGTNYRSNLLNLAP